MGFSISWLAVKTQNLESLFKVVGVSQGAEIEDPFASKLFGGALKQGWYFIQAQGCDHRIISGEVLSRTSTLGETVACSVEEHVMASVAEGWKDGNRRWRISHDAQHGRFDLSGEGSLPEGYERIRADMIAEQQSEGGEDAAVDLIFDIPLQVAKQTCGYKHDEDPKPWLPPGPIAFDELESFKALSKKPWWRFR